MGFWILFPYFCHYLLHASLHGSPAPVTAIRRQRTRLFEGKAFFTWSEIKKDPLPFISMIIAFLASIMLWTVSPLPLWANIPLFLFILPYLLAIFPAPVITLLFLSITRLVLCLIDIIVVEPIAMILSNETLDLAIKLFAFVTLIVGFHFDLLAS